jgi:hypothetical protein
MSLRGVLTKPAPLASDMPANKPPMAKEPVQDVATLVKELEADSFGPAMAALQPKRRAFVAYAMAGKSFAEAARLAGYGKPSSDSNTLARIGYRVSHYPDVIEALIEESRKSVRTLLPKSIEALREIVDDRFHRDRAKVALNLLERVDPTVVKHDVNVTHRIDPMQFLISEFVRLRELGASKKEIMRVLGLQTEFEWADMERRLPAPKEPVTVEYSEVTPDA